MEASPATCQKTFSPFASFSRVIFTAELTVRSPAIWKTQTSLELPEMVTSVNAKPLIYDVAAGVRPKLPVITDVGLLFIVVLARITYFSADPRSTAVVPVAHSMVVNDPRKFLQAIF